MMVRLLFATRGCDPVLYRTNIGWIVEAMNPNRFEIQTVDCSYQNISPLISNYDIILYYRVMGFENSGIYQVKKLRKLTGYMIDDYLLEQGQGNLIRQFMAEVDFITVTTPILRQLYQDAGINKPFFIKHDGIPVEKILSFKKTNESVYKFPDRFRLGWLGGLRHGTPEYLGLIENILSTLSATLSNGKETLEFICFGKPVSFENQMARLPHISVINLPFIPFEDEARYYSTIANLGLDAVLCPITHTRLDMGKAEIKFLETGIFKIPIICSRFGIYKEVIEEGVTGMLADGIREFVEKVLYLIRNPGFRKVLGENAYQKIVSTYKIEKRAREFEEFLLKVLREGTL